MVNALDFRLSSLDVSLGQGPSTLFLGKVVYSHSASLHPGVELGTSKCNPGVTLQ